MRLAGLLVLLLLLTPLTAVAVPPAVSLDTASATESLPRQADPQVHWVGKGLSLYKTNYLLPLTWSNRATTSADAELIFQLSIKQQVARLPLYLAYTQKSFWRILDQANSRPFRETNYNPELFYRYLRPGSGLLIWGIDGGGEHESNGASDPESRSWNRLYVRPFFSYKRLRGSFKLWYRWPEDPKTGPADTGGDDNPDIYKYYGYGELSLGYMFSNRWQRDHMLNLQARFNPATGKGGLQVDYTLPTLYRNAFWVAHLWSGYGESLSNYNHSLTRFGIGVMFKR